MPDWNMAALTWFDVDLPNALADPNDDESIHFILSRMWLCQMMAESHVEDYSATVKFLRQELAAS